ncbi:MAG: hypothetical protein ABI988_01110, partial [Nitrospirota bacterium]
RFSVQPAQPAARQRPRPASRELDRSLCLLTTRCLRRDWTVAHHGPLYQRRSHVRATHVIVEDRVEGTLWRSHKGRPLTYQAIIAHPLRVPPPLKRALAAHGHTDTRASMAQTAAADTRRTRSSGLHITRTLLLWEKEDISTVA